MLTELTVLYPHPLPCPGLYSPTDTEARTTPDVMETIRSTTLELVKACKGLPNFDTLQIVYFTLTPPPPTHWCRPWWSSGPGYYSEQREQSLREEIQGVKDWTIDCLKEPETGCQEGEGREKVVLREQMKRVKDRVAFRPKSKRRREKTTLRVIELISALTLPLPERGSPMWFHLDFVKVEEYEVWASDSNLPTGSVSFAL